MHQVLILEDDPVIAADIRMIVEEAGEFATYRAADSTGAFSIAAKHPLDIVIADIRIRGETDGTEVAAMLHRLYGSVTIFVSSYSDDATLRGASAAECIGYLVKPFSSEQLEALLHLAAMKKGTIGEEAVDVGQEYRYQRREGVLLHRGEEVALTAKEALLFALLFNNRGSVVSYDEVDAVIWNERCVDAGTRRQLFHRLRTKLPELPLQSVTREGYIFQVNV